LLSDEEAILLYPTPILYRKRFIPNEIVNLKNDRIVYIDDCRIKTEWEVLKPRNDFASGISWYLLDRGFKISKFFNADGELHCIYCDIVEYEYNQAENAYVFSDLLVDIVIHSDGTVNVLDIGEIVEALEQSLISLEQAKDALTKLDALLEIIYSGRLMDLIEGF